MYCKCLFLDLLLIFYSTVMSSQPPNLTNLVNALDDLPASEVHYLCTKLGVSQCTLDKIDADYRDALTRVPKYLQAWLDCDERIAWSR